jgi:hypothetical protein
MIPLVLAPEATQSPGRLNESRVGSTGRKGVLAARVSQQASPLSADC